MSSRNQQNYLEDIAESIELIDEFLIGVELATYRTDHKTRLAVERLLQNLTEAAYRLGADAEKLCPAVDWRSVRGLGNVLRHEYDDIDDAIIWQAIQTRLPSMKADVQSALAKLRSPAREEPL